MAGSRLPSLFEKTHSISFNTAPEHAFDDKGAFIAPLRLHQQPTSAL
jgi:hypothetical protein